jgi:predicted amidohydrolase YtcJ
MPWAETRVGPDRIKGAYAWRRFLESGSVIVGGSDFPVESDNPLLGFYAAITRADRDGNPPGGWYPDQKMTREEAARCYSLWAAYGGFQEEWKGTIEPGKCADLTVFGRDIMKIEPKEILTTPVAMTVVGGRIVYRRPASL